MNADLKSRRERRLITHAIYDATSRSWIHRPWRCYRERDLILAFISGGLVTGLFLLMVTVS